MTFTSLPEMFSSVFGPLAYTFSNAAETELFLEILSTRDGSRIGSKRFYNTPTGTLNIAPMVRKNIRFVPSSGMTGFCNSESRSASVQLAVGTTYSEVRTFVAAHDSVKPSRILTTMPSHRIIAYGESDEITCCIPGQHTVTVTSDITAEALTYNAIGGEELTLFRLNTRSFLPSVGTITVRIATAGQTVAEIGYTVVPKCDEGCRIAWRSRAGSIEHYTFPVVKSVVQKIRKEQVLTDDAGYEDISIRDERTTTLASAFEPAAVIEALAEIAASPQVWKIDGDKYEEVDILTREQTIGRHGSPGLYRNQPASPTRNPLPMKLTIDQIPCDLDPSQRIAPRLRCPGSRRRAKRKQRARPPTAAAGNPDQRPHFRIRRRALHGPALQCRAAHGRFERRRGQTAARLRPAALGSVRLRPGGVSDRDPQRHLRMGPASRCGDVQHPRHLLLGTAHAHDDPPDLDQQHPGQILPGMPRRIHPPNCRRSN